MFEFKICKTRDYHPTIIEHFLHTIQKDKIVHDFFLVNQNGKIKFFTNENLEKFFLGSRFVERENQTSTTNLFVKQTKGVLMPIKRYSQFEDRVNKERIYSMDNLIFAMAKVPNSVFKISFAAISEKKREKAIKKAKKSWFKPERKFDNWESEAWFSFKLRKIFGPMLRKFFTQLENVKIQMEKTETIHEREDIKTAVLDKLSRPLFKVEISMSHPFKHFINGFGLAYLNSLKVTNKKSQIILSAEELASILNLPNPKNCESEMELENTAYLPPPANALEMSEDDRQRHLYILGKTGMGKSTLMLDLINKAFKNGETTIVLDPHGDLVLDALNLIPVERSVDLIYINPAADDFPIAINPLELLEGENPNLKASNVTEIFEILAKGSWGPRLEYILRNAILTLILSKNTCLLDLPRLISNADFCREKLSQVKDFELKRFWEEEFFCLDLKTRQEFIAPILNKVGPLLTSPLLRNIFGQPLSKFHFEKAIDKKKIILINLSKGLIGEDASRMLGMIFISQIESALLKRAAKNREERSLLSLFIDEFQNFSTRTLIGMLSEARKYGLALTIANQYISQLPPEIQDTVLGNVGSLITFRSSFEDAEKISPILGLLPEDLSELEPFNAYAKILKNSKIQPLFRYETQKIPESKNLEIEKFKRFSIEKYGRARSFVEEKLIARYT